MRIHLIATGGAVMHNLALALQKNGHQVSGSDDEIYNPAKDRLSAAGLLPPAFGWFPEKITPELDLVILGMHARADNPELARALELGVKVYSFPEFIFEQSKNKTRIVVAGSHGKTSTTAMIMHVLRISNIHFDYLVGSQLEGFDTMVQLSDAPVIVIEGDEYLSSPIDRRPKFLHYQPHVTIVTGVAWDHINVFPTYENYKHQFELLLENLAPGGKVIYFEKDGDLAQIVEKSAADIRPVPYSGFQHRVLDGKFWIKEPGCEALEMQVFGEHNMANLQAAQLACLELGISKENFLQAAASFRGAAKRLQSLAGTPDFSAWLDFAHAPSKAKATVEAVRKLHPGRRLVACLELHTFSSLNKNFLPHYAGSMDPAGTAVVFYSPHTLEMKKMPPVAAEEIRQSFDRPDLEVFTERTDLEAFLKKQNWENANLLLMSSGNFGGMNVLDFVKNLK
jgi:UDP-N-acetylmuramate: L-alanyl-gamma-D-glutamyl-meso-diaminopimelate ligase